MSCCKRSYTWMIPVALATAFVILPANPGEGNTAGRDAAASTGPSWRTDPAWDRGKAEWALYDATRVIYGEPRRYDAAIFTNTQHMDPETTTKAADWRDPDAIPVFKHNVSEIVPTENYKYRFLTTSFVRTEDLSPYKVVASSQEDCGSTYKQFVVADDRVDAMQFSYFPGEGRSDATYDAPSALAFHDALTLTLRDFPFEQATPGAEQTIQLVADQTDNHASSQRSASATLRFEGVETVEVPHGDVECFHLAVLHDAVGGAQRSDYWFATDPDMLHVLVKYEGPYGVRYELKKRGWWAYWNANSPRPE